MKNAALENSDRHPEELGQLLTATPAADFPASLFGPRCGARRTCGGRAACYVPSENLVHGDALTMRTQGNLPNTFAERGYLGKGRFQRRDFRFDSLTQSSAYSAAGSLVAHLGKHELFTPTKPNYPPMTVGELAAVASGGAEPSSSRPEVRP